MIFYFSGTGNSKHIAKYMKDEKLINIGEASKCGKFRFRIQPGESVGIICPVYYEALPKTVISFIKQFEILGELEYVYCILTHGGGPGAAGYMLEKLLAKKEYPLHACYDVEMASNYIMFGPLQKEEKERSSIIEAELKMAGIKDKIDSRLCEKPNWSIISKALTYSMYPLCLKNMSVKKFYADGTCTGCGLCVKRCPAGLIKMVDGRPVWDEKKCVRCMACLQCKSAQCGRKTKNYRRYTYKPVVSKEI